MFTTGKLAALLEISEKSKLVTSGEKKIEAGTPKTPHALPSPKANPDESDIVSKIHHMCSEVKITIEEIKKDAETLFAFLSPPLSVKFNSTSKDYSQTLLSPKMSKELEQKDFQPDIIFMFGNNDEYQAELVANYFHSLIKSHRTAPEIIIAGKGGHATVATPIFGFTEAETLKQKLIELNVPSSLIKVETESVNTGLNIKNTIKMIPPGSKHVVISSTFSTLFRQLVSIFHQSSHKWETVSIISAEWTEINKRYFSLKPDLYINFMYMLREVATYMNYILNEDFLEANIKPSTEHLSKSIEILCKYFNLLTNTPTLSTPILVGPKLSGSTSVSTETSSSSSSSSTSSVGSTSSTTPIDSTISPKVIISKFLEALDLKAKGLLYPKEFDLFRKEMFALSEYFRCMFNIMERQNIRQLRKTTLWGQSELLNRTYGCLDLATPTSASLAGGRKPLFSP